PFIHMGFLDLMDWIFGNIMLAVGALFLSIFIAWVWKTENAINEIRRSGAKFKFMGIIFNILIKFFCPAVILALIFFLVTK
ncbi:MAG TPA: hypothetical protein VKO43_07850, partial [Candidatus Krumholzibacteriaceae bacterium]|nr:hypothetical protein [Candidatus Krumholzibacteriaceae bacterium]